MLLFTAVSLPLLHSEAILQRVYSMLEPLNRILVLLLTFLDLFRLSYAVEVLPFRDSCYQL